MAKVSVNIVTWNGARYLPELMKSLTAQTFQDFVIRIIDNGSDDGTVEYLEKNYPSVMVVRNKKNHGFAAGHNQAIRYTLGRLSDAERADHYVLVTNQDIIFSEDFLENMIREADQYAQVGSFAGKLLRAYGENLHDEYLKETVRSDRIDSTGLRGNRRRRFTDRGAGELDEGQFEQGEDIFGVSGALALYRAQALVEAELDSGYFDEDFFSYREDVDLAWRLQTIGWRARYVPSAVAYHFRGIYGKEKSGLMQRIKDRKKKSQYFAALSTRNHWLMLVKNETWLNGLIALPLVLPLELARLGYIAVFETGSLWIVPNFIKLLPRAISKRLTIAKRKKTPAAVIRKWLS